MRRTTIEQSSALVSVALATVLAFAAGPVRAERGDLSATVVVAAEEPHLPDPVPRVGAIRRGPDGKIETIDPTARDPKALSACATKTICVGAGQAYTSLGAALAVAREGDVIEIIGGTYRESDRIGVKNVTLRGVGGRVHFDCAGLHLVSDKACLLLAANGITLENLEISGGVLAESAGANGACVRNEPNLSFTLRHVACHGSQDGILSEGGVIVVENSEFYDNGWTELTHNVYFGGNCSVTVRGSTFRDARIGHEFKSRCYETTISDSTFRSTKGSRDLDIPDGGETKIYRSTFEKTRGADNYEIIAFAAESCAHPGDMLLKDIIVINSQPEAAIHNYNRCSGHPIIIDGMTVQGLPPKQYGYIKTATGVSDLAPMPTYPGALRP